MSKEQVIVIIISVLIGASFVLGWLANRARIKSLDAWFRNGLEQMGDVSKPAYINPASIGLRLSIKQKPFPFKVFDAIFILQRRENLPLWAYQLLMGKRDTILFQAKAHHLPDTNFQIIRRGDRVSVERQNYQSQALQFLETYHDFDFYSTQTVNETFLQALKDFIDKTGNHFSNMTMNLLMSIIMT